MRVLSVPATFSVPVIFSCAIANKTDTFLRYNARKLRMILDAVVNFDIQYLTTSTFGIGCNRTCLKKSLKVAGTESTRTESTSLS